MAKRKIHTLQRINSNEYPNGLPGKNSLNNIFPGKEVWLNKSKSQVHDISHDDLKRVNPRAAANWIPTFIEDAYHAKSFYGDNNQYHAWTTRIIVDGKSYAHCIVRGFVKTKGKDILI